METIEQKIQQKACEMGYAKCGIVPLEEMDGFAEKLEERMQKLPASKGFYERQRRLTKLREQYPWAKSAVVVVANYGKYKIPAEVDGKIGKLYLCDLRIDSGSQEFYNRRTMESYLLELGLKVESNRNFGIMGLRWAAMKAGLGVIRKNNFFYTEDGSWVELDGWLTDKEMDLREACNLPPCPKECRRCMDACPTGSLKAPYTMLPVTCISFLTTFGSHEWTGQERAKQTGNWMYGCDACQDACPMNKGKWKHEEEFPGLAELAGSLTPESIMELDEDLYNQTVQPRFFYVSKDELWKWRANALNYMYSHYNESYKPYILTALQDKNETVRSVAKNICGALFGE